NGERPRARPARKGDGGERVGGGQLTHQHLDVRAALPPQQGERARVGVGQNPVQQGHGRSFGAGAGGVAVAPGERRRPPRRAAAWSQVSYARTVWAAIVAGHQLLSRASTAPSITYGGGAGGARRRVGTPGRKAGGHHPGGTRRRVRI